MVQCLSRNILCSILLRITHFSDQKRILNANYLYATKLPNPMIPKTLLSIKGSQLETLLWLLEFMILKKS